MPSSTLKKISALLSRGTRTRMPSGITPMLATLVDRPFDREGWLYEVKWDGYRTLAYLDRGKVLLRSRNNKSFDEKYYPITRSLEQWNVRAVLDGEIIVLGKNGVSDFSSLQNWRSEADGELVLYLFDVLWFDGYHLMELPLSERRALLATLSFPAANIRISEAFYSGATQFFEVARKLRIEGIMAKRTDSIYVPGKRSRDWLKIKTGNRQEVVIGGFTKNEGTRKTFSSLLVGVFQDGRFIYTGKIGTGFTAARQQELIKQFRPLVTRKTPFDHEPDINKPSRFRPDPPRAEVTWLKPELVCEVTFAELTPDGVMRHPSFEGMRTDKRAADVHLETGAPAGAVIQPPETAKPPKKKSSGTRKQPRHKTEKGERLATTLLKEGPPEGRRTLLNPTEKSQTRTSGGHSIVFNNLDKIFFPAARGRKAVTKRDVINYYYQVAGEMLPYMQDRPQTLIRYPNGINGKSFYQKDVTGKVPAWAKVFPYSSEAGGDRNFLVCSGEASLLLIASMGGLEMHPWSSRVQHPDHPDWCILDLDPSEKTRFDQVITAAQTIRQLLDQIGVRACCKTSGATGIHIYIPFGARYTYEQSREFGRILATLVHRELRTFTSIERVIKNRDGKMYIDFLQNRPQATLAAPYSLRPRPEATVSMPLHWDEVRGGLKIKDFTIFNAVARIGECGDLFRDVLGRGIDLKKAMRRLTTLFDGVEVPASLQHL